MLDSSLQIFFATFSSSKGASNCMVLEHVTTYAFLQIRSAKYKRSLKNFTKRLFVNKDALF